MLGSFVALAGAVALTGAVPGPSPAPSASPAVDRTLTVVCARAPFYVFVSGSDRPQRAHTQAATAGERFALVSGPRTTLESIQYYETNVAIVEPGYPAGDHYWLNGACAIPSR